MTEQRITIASLLEDIEFVLYGGLSDSYDIPVDGESVQPLARTCELAAQAMRDVAAKSAPAGENNLSLAQAEHLCEIVARTVQLAIISSRIESNSSELMNKRIELWKLRTLLRLAEMRQNLNGH